jgi:hypothetical protein
MVARGWGGQERGVVRGIFVHESLPTHPSPPPPPPTLAHTCQCPVWGLARAPGSQAVALIAVRGRHALPCVNARCPRGERSAKSFKVFVADLSAVTSKTVEERLSELVAHYRAKVEGQVRWASLVRPPPPLYHHHHCHTHAQAHTHPPHIPTQLPLS